MNRILVIDDEPAVVDVVVFSLRQSGFVVQAAGTLAEARRLLDAQSFDLLVLDLGLPDGDGMDLCREVRSGSGLPVLILTCRDDEVDRVVGLESGADDYVVKPFKPKELVARIRARIRRNDEAPTQVLLVGDLEIDVSGHTVKRDGELLSLTPLEFDLLVCLARKPGQVFTREVLLQEVWGYRPAADTRLVNVHVQRLRAKVELDPERPDIVLTVRGVGYKAGPA